MKRPLLLLCIHSAFAFNDLLAAPPSYIQTKDGVIVFTDPSFTGSSKAVKLEVVSDPGACRLSSSTIPRCRSHSLYQVITTEYSGIIIRLQKQVTHGRFFRFLHCSFFQKQYTDHDLCMAEIL